MQSIQTVHCSSCGASNYPTNKFCSVCGNVLAEEKTICPQCQAENKTKNLFCVGCGYRLKAEKDTSSPTPAFQTPPVPLPVDQTSVFQGLPAQMPANQTPGIQAPPRPYYPPQPQQSVPAYHQTYAPPYPAPTKAGTKPKLGLWIGLGVGLLAIVLIAVFLLPKLIKGKEITRDNIHNLQKITSVDYEGFYNFDFNHSNNILAISNEDEDVLVYDLNNGQLMRKLRFNDDIDHIAISPSGQHIAVGVENENLTIWNIKNGEKHKTLNSPDDTYNLAWSPDGKTLAVCYYDDTFLLWDIKSGKSTFLDDRCGEIAWSANGKYILSGDSYFSPLSSVNYGFVEDPTLYDVSKRSEISVPVSGEETVERAFFSPDGNTLIYNDYDGSRIYIWDIGTHTPKEIVTEFGYTDGRMLSPDGSMLIVFDGNYDELELQIYDLSSKTRLTNIDRSNGSLENFMWVSDSKTLILVYSDSIDTFDVKSGQIIKSVKKDFDDYLDITISPNGQILSTSDHGDENLYFWDTSTGERLSRIRNSRGDYWGVEWLNNGSGLLVFYEDFLDIWALP